MRLVCPNCSAQYEIDGSVIPDEGRDVQCSNCGHTWFELPPSEFSDEPATLTEAEAISEPVEDKQEYQHIGDEFDVDPTEEPSHESEDKAQSDTLDTELEISPGASRAVPPENDEFFADTPNVADRNKTRLMPQGADAAAIGILREEAQRELAQRRAPPSDAFEAQGDLGLDVRSKVAPNRAFKARKALLDGDAEDQSDQQTDDAYEEPRRDLLPDIDELNSTLKSSRKSRADAGVDGGQAGFRAGFFLMLCLAILLLIAYVFAPALAKAIPGLEPTLAKYVDLANQFRDWLGGLLSRLVS